MNKNTPLVKVPREVPRSVAKTKLVAIKGSKPFHPNISHVPTDDRVAVLNRLASTPPFCITHRVKKNDVL